MQKFGHPPLVECVDRVIAQAVGEALPVQRTAEVGVLAFEVGSGDVAIGIVALSQSGGSLESEAERDERGEGVGHRCLGHAW